MHAVCPRLVLWLLLLVGAGLAGCASGSAPYREFTRSIDFDRLQSFRVEGPFLPGALDSPARFERYAPLIRKRVRDLMRARGFRENPNLADADMVVELAWSQGRQVNPEGGMRQGVPVISQPPTLPTYRLHIRVFETQSGEIFWRNTPSTPLSSSQLSEFAVLEMTRAVLEPFPGRAER